MSKKIYEEELEFLSGLLDNLTNLIHNYYDKDDINNEYIDSLEYKYKELMIKYNNVYNIINDDKNNV